MDNKNIDLLRKTIKNSEWLGIFALQNVILLVAAILIILFMAIGLSELRNLSEQNRETLSKLHELSNKADQLQSQQIALNQQEIENNKELARRNQAIIIQTAEQFNALEKRITELEKQAK